MESFPELEAVGLMALMLLQDSPARRTRHADGAI
jgi:hypothetical protein